jgi:hypothetical protein
MALLVAERFLSMAGRLRHRVARASDVPDLYLRQTAHRRNRPWAIISRYNDWS